MYGRSGLDRFKKAQSSEPFSVTENFSPNKTNQSSPRGSLTSSVQYPDSQVYSVQNEYQKQLNVSQKNVGPEAAPLLGQTQTQSVTQAGGGQSTWQPPDWAIEPIPGVYYLEVLKDGQILDRVNLDKRRQIFGRQFPTCDYVLDHQSVSRQHAAVVPHKNGSIYVIDLGSAHGTFVANERLTKDTPVELEVGQSLRFAASTRTYILRKNNAALFPSTPSPAEINLPPPPDPSDEEAVVAYNTLINRYGLGKASLISKSNGDDDHPPVRVAKRAKKMRVAFRDQAGGVLVEVVGFSDGVDVETEPGPIGVKEGSLVGKYESLVQTTIIPKGKEQLHAKEDNGQKGVTDKLQQVLNKVRNPPKGSIYDDLYGESFSGKVGSSWANPSSNDAGRVDPPSKDAQTKQSTASANSVQLHDDNDDDLFGD